MNSADMCIFKSFLLVAMTTWTSRIYKSMGLIQGCPHRVAAVLFPTKSLADPSDFWNHLIACRVGRRQIFLNRECLQSGAFSDFIQAKALLVCEAEITAPAAGEKTHWP